MAKHTNEAKLALTRERILVEAVAFADVHGVDALSMRKLAEQLGTGAMSLYNHVSNKDEMIEGMVDIISAEIDHPVAGDDWRCAMRASAASAHAVLRAHRWAASEWTRRLPGRERLLYMDAILRTLTDAGLSSHVVYHGYHAITMHIVGFTIQELGYQAMPIGVDLDTKAASFLSGLEKANMPHLAQHVRDHVGDDDHGDEFGWVLDLILDGLDRSSES